MSKVAKFEDLIPMKLDESRIYLAMTKFSYELRQQLQDRAEVLGSSWKDFKQMLFDEFPDSIDNGQGSLARLHRIVATYQKALDWDLEKLKAYHRAFKLEHAKLAKPPALISNLESVGLYLSGLPEVIKQRVINRMDYWSMNRLEVVTRDRRKMDPWQLKD
ncbi:hypothetical protein MPER_07562, partial [Moniliophthora perniciosa FA553]